MEILIVLLIIAGLALMVYTPVLFVALLGCCFILLATGFLFYQFLAIEYVFIIEFAFAALMVSSAINGTKKRL